jgi:hypothetical protein
MKRPQWYACPYCKKKSRVHYGRDGVACIDSHRCLAPPDVMQKVVSAVYKKVYTELCNRFR